MIHGLKIGTETTPMNRLKPIDRQIERITAFLSFVVAAILAFVGMYIGDEGVISSSVLFASAQFLTFTATVFGIDYKFSEYGKDKGYKEQ